MKKCLAIASLGFAISLTTASAFGVPIAGSAYWSFNVGSPGAGSNSNVAYTTTITPTFAFPAPDEDALPGTPVFRVNGTYVYNPTAGSNNLGDYTSTSGSIFPVGRTVRWERDNGGNNSTGNSFQLEFDSTGFEDFQLKFQYRLTTGISYAITAIEYSLDNINFEPTGLTPPATGSGLTANQTWRQLTFNFANLNEIENQSSVYLRFRLPDFTANANSFSIDNVELTSTEMVPEPTALFLIGLSTIGLGCVIRARKSRK